MKHILLSACALSILLTGCASKSKDIKATYVSPIEYQNYSCSQIGKELKRVNRRLIDVSGAQDDIAGNDAVAMGVGLVLFWPSLFFIAGDDQKEEVGRLKGEYDALEQAAIEKDCDISKDIEKARQAREEHAQKRAEEEAQYKKDLNN